MSTAIQPKFRIYYFNNRHNGMLWHSVYASSRRNAWTALHKEDWSFQFHSDNTKVVKDDLGAFTDARTNDELSLANWVQKTTQWDHEKGVMLVVDKHR